MTLQKGKKKKKETGDRKHRCIIPGPGQKFNIIIIKINAVFTSSTVTIKQQKYFMRQNVHYQFLKS